MSFSKIPAQHSQDLSWKQECVAQAQTGRLKRSKGLRQVQNQCHRSSILFFCFAIKPFHLHQDLPHGLLGSSIPAICGVPIHTILLLPVFHFWCPQCFPPTYQRWHGRNRHLTRDILWDQEEDRRAGLLRLCSTFSKTSTISPLVSCVQSKGTLGWKPSRPTPVFALYNLDAFAVNTPFSFGKASSTFLNSSFSKACPSSSARSHHTASALPILPSLLRNDPTTLHSLLSLGPVSTIGTVSFLQ